MADRCERTIFNNDDGNVSVLNGKTLAIIGYGRLGRPLALNLRDGSPATIIVGSADESSTEMAREDHFPVFPIAEATRRADLVLLLIPDEVQPALYKKEMESSLRPGAALVFASGYNLTFDPISISGDVDVLLFAPRMLGSIIRRLFQEGEGFISYISVEQDATGNAWNLLLALAKGTGCLRRGAVQFTAEEEAHLDLFGEQALGPWLGAAILTCFEVGREAGLPPEGLLLEMYLSGEMSQTFQAMADQGFLRSTDLHGYAATFGGMMRSLAVDREALAKSMREALSDIRSGAFARQLREEVEAGYPSRSFLEEMRSEENLMNQVEDALRRKLDGDRFQPT